MEMTATSFENRAVLAYRTASDFGALVALVAANQAALPISRSAIRLVRDGDSQTAVESLIALFAPRHGEREGGTIAACGALAGSFSPAVPHPHTTLTRKQPW